MKDEKICPLLGGKYCQGHKCAWWITVLGSDKSKDYAMCSVAMLARNSFAS